MDDEDDVDDVDDVCGVHVGDVGDENAENVYAGYVGAHKVRNLDAFCILCFVVRSLRQVVVPYFFRNNCWRIFHCIMWWWW